MEALLSTRVVVDASSQLSYIVVTSVISLDSLTLIPWRICTYLAKAEILRDYIVL